MNNLLIIHLSLKINNKLNHNNYYDNIMINASNSLEDTTMTSLNNSKAPCCFNDLSLKSQLSYSKNYVPKEAFFGTTQNLNQDDNYDKSSSIFS